MYAYVYLYTQEVILKNRFHYDSMLMMVMTNTTIARRCRQVGGYKSACGLLQLMQITFSRHFRENVFMFDWIIFTKNEIISNFILQEDFHLPKIASKRCYLRCDNARICLIASVTLHSISFQLQQLQASSKYKVREFQFFSNFLFNSMIIIITTITRS